MESDSTVVVRERLVFRAGRRGGSVIRGRASRAVGAPDPSGAKRTLKNACVSRSGRETARHFAPNTSFLPVIPVFQENRNNFDFSLAIVRAA